MPRKLRTEYPGAIYHVTSRGNRREDIFPDEVDRQDFVKTLADARQKTGWQVSAANIRRMVKGNASCAAKAQQIGGRVTYDF
jgi:REP element-mobilizing transposase RayT